MRIYQPIEPVDEGGTPIPSQPAPPPITLPPISVPPINVRPISTAPTGRTIPFDLGDDKIPVVPTPDPPTRPGDLEDPYGPGDVPPPNSPWSKDPTKPKVASKLPPVKGKYAGTGIVGGARSVGDQMNALALINKFWGGEVTANNAVIRRFMGLYTKPGRDHAPLGALEDVRNLEPNVKTGALTLRKGSSAYASAFVDASAAVTLTQIDRFFPLSTEVPEASDVDVVLGQTSGSVKHVFQKPFWQDGSKVSSYMDWNETYSDVVDETFAPENFPRSTFTMTEGAGYGTDYFKGWGCIIGDITNRPYIVTAYNTSNGEVTVFPQLSTAVNNPDTVRLFRFPLKEYASNGDFTDPPVSYSTTSGKPPVCLQQGQAVLFSGGQSSSDSHRFLWSGYIDRTWLLNATNKEAGVRIARTEVTWAHVTKGLADAFTVGNPSATNEDTNPLPTGNWFLKVVPATDDGIMGLPISPSTPNVLVGTGGDATQELSATLTLKLPVFNKRVRYLHILLGKAGGLADTTIGWSDLYVVKTLDLEDGTGWTYNESATTTLGTYTYALTLDSNDWNNAEEKTKLDLYLGTDEPTGIEISASVAEFASGRLFVAKYYDHTAGIEYNDQIRYSQFAGNGIGQVNFLGDIDQYSQSTIELGDATSIQGLKKWEDKLFVIKDTSCYYIGLTDDSSTWQVITISPHIGIGTAMRTLTATPYGVMWCNPGDDVYLWDGGVPVAQTQDTWRETFKALTTPATWTGWYSTAKKCFSFFSPTTDFWYSMFFETPVAEGIFPWFKFNIPTNWYGEVDQDIVNSVDDFCGVREGVEYFIYNYTNDVMAVNDRIGYLSTSATTDVGGLGIVPYLKTAEMYIDEVMLTKVHHFWVANYNTGLSETFGVRITLDSTTQTYSHATTLVTLIRRGVLHESQNCRKVQLELNYGATTATLPATFTAFEIHQIGFEYELLPFVGDKTITS